MRKILSLLVTLFFAALLMSTARADDGVTVTSNKIKDLNLRIYGFVETDVIADTTQGFTEVQGNNLVPTQTATSGSTNNLLNHNNAQNFPGDAHRTEMSVRNTRLGFDLTLPKTTGGLATEAVIELDLFGNNAPNTVPGAAPGTQTESNFFNNPAVRVRHAYLNLTYDDSLNAKIGQYWSLLGWQPYYFPGETIVLPGVAQLYSRFVQARATYTQKIQDAWTLESAFDAAKPAEMNSGNPELHAGTRLASTKYKATSINGGSTSMVGLSVGVSGALIPIETAGMGNPTGQAYAIDAAIPIIPSKDGKDRSNTLIAVGEFMEGNGVGGLELTGATMGVPQVTNTTASGSAVDPGIAGVNEDTNLELIKLRSWRYNLQYALPGGKWAISSGYAQLEARNLNRFGASGALLAGSTLASANAAIKTWSGLTPKIQYGYMSAMYDPFSWLRFAGEIIQTRDTYNDPNNRFATDNRCQLSAFFIF